MATLAGAVSKSNSKSNSKSKSKVLVTLTCSAQKGTRTPTPCGIRPSNVHVYQFHHLGRFNRVSKLTNPVLYYKLNFMQKDLSGAF